jgi:hypothetical protein
MCLLDHLKLKIIVGNRAGDKTKDGRSGKMGSFTGGHLKIKMKSRFDTIKGKREGLEGVERNWKLISLKRLKWFSTPIKFHSLIH